MAFIDDVNAAIADAMRKTGAARLSALRMLKAALMNREVESGRALDDGEARQVVSSLVKQRKDSIEQFTKGGRQDLAGQGSRRDRASSSPTCRRAPTRQPSSAPCSRRSPKPARPRAKDMGRVMKAAMAKLAGQSVDGKAVNELVRQKLAGSSNRRPTNPTGNRGSRARPA